jgi:hypothetical protein
VKSLGSGNFKGYFRRMRNKSSRRPEAEVQTQFLSKAQSAAEPQKNIAKVSVSVF